METIFIIALLFSLAANVGIFLYFRGEIVKLKCLLEQPKGAEAGEKIPIEKQWSDFLAYDGRGK